MPNNIGSVLGQYADTLVLRSRRAEILANNLANADTPGFKARDMDFANALKDVTKTAIQLKTTSAGHVSSAALTTSNSEDLMYRVPTQPSLDGNTVETHIEQAEFSRNALQYQATLTFLNGRIKGLKGALKGE